VLNTLYDALGIEPSSITSMLFANDMGGAALASEVARDTQMGRFNGTVVASMMGCTISFTVAFSLNAVKSHQHRPLLLGLLCGIVTIPVGCFAGGFVLHVPTLPLLYNLLPLFIFSLLVAAGLMLFPELSTKIFGALGTSIKILITVGLILGIVCSLSGYEIISGLNPLEDAGIICLNAAIVMTGAFPLLKLLSKLLGKRLNALGKRIGIDETASLGLISCLANSISTFDMMGKMNEKGVMLNAAFAVSAAFVFGDHLAFTLAYDPECLIGVIIGKLTAGLLALLAANFMYRRLCSRK
jgi:ethanolamine transporter